MINDSIGIVAHNPHEDFVSEVRTVQERFQDFHEFRVNPPVTILIPDGKSPRQKRREAERKNKVRMKRKPLYTPTKA